MKDEKISNYVKLCEDWADKFMKMDLENLRKRVPELKEEKGFLRWSISGENTESA